MILNMLNKNKALHIVKAKASMHTAPTISITNNIIYISIFCGSSDFAFLFYTEIRFSFGQQQKAKIYKKYGTKQQQQQKKNVLSEKNQTFMY